MSHLHHLTKCVWGLSVHVFVNLTRLAPARQIEQPMTGKRPHPDSERLFLSRKGASDIANADIEAPGSYISGKIFSKNPTKNQYTIDIRRDSSSKATYLDIVIEEKLQRRLELLVGDHLHISLKGAQLLPRSGPASHVPALLRFQEGITILIVSRAGLQGEKGKLFHVWPISSAYSSSVHLSLTFCSE